MKPICRSKTFQKGEDTPKVFKFIIENIEWVPDHSSSAINSNLAHKTIITITKVVEESETKIDEG